MTLARKDTRGQSTFIPEKVLQKAQTPPPPSVSAIVTESKDLELEPCRLKRGQKVRICATRADRFQYIEQEGKIAAVIYPHDVTRTIVYVTLPSGTPCFFASEVQPCS